MKNYQEHAHARVCLNTLVRARAPTLRRSVSCRNAGLYMYEKGLFSGLRLQG